MAKGRMIPTTLNQSSSWGRLTQFARYFFINIIVQADDQGRMTNVPVLLKANVLPWSTQPIEKFAEALELLEKEGFVVLYTAGRDDLLQIVDWWEYQSLSWAQPSEYPAPEGWVDRIRYRGRESVVVKNWDAQGGFCRGNQNESGNGSVGQEAEGKDGRGKKEGPHPLVTDTISDAPHPPGGNSEPESAESCYEGAAVSSAQVPQSDKPDGGASDTTPALGVNEAGKGIPIPIGKGIGMPIGIGIGNSIGKPIGIPIGKPIGIPIGKGIGIPIGKGIGIPIPNPIGIEIGNWIGMPIGMGIGMPINESKLTESKIKLNKTTTTRVRAHEEPGEPEADVAAAETLPEAVKNDLGLIGWADGYGEILEIYNQSPELVTAWLDTTLASDIPPEQAAGYFRNRIRDGNMPPRREQPKQAGMDPYLEWVCDDPFFDNDAAEPDCNFPDAVSDVPEKPREVWSWIKTQLRQELNPGTYNTWIKDIQLISAEKGVYEFAVKDRTAAAWLDDRLKKTITNYFTGVLDIPLDEIEIKFVARG